MTGIPDEVVEIVARAIVKAQYAWVPDDKLVDMSPYTMQLASARAALSASKYVEMREALTQLVHAIELVCECAPYDPTPDIDRARAALTIKLEGGQ